MSALHTSGIGQNGTLGVDFGGVINSGSLEFFQNYPQDVPPMLDAFSTLRRLVKERFGDRVWVVSKAGPQTQRKTRLWFAHHDFSQLTLVVPEQITFCTRRSDKAYFCRDLEITHFIDDRLEVLINLDPSIIKYLFRPSDQDRERQRRQFADSIHIVESWQEVGQLLLPP